MAEIAAINKFTQALRGGDIDTFYAAGDELRQKLQQNGLIKDRSYRLKVCCFTTKLQSAAMMARGLTMLTVFVEVPTMLQRR
jgi:hypothetical protein